MQFGLRSFIIIAGIIAALIAAAIVFIPDVPKFEEAIYFLAAGVVCVGVAHFVKE